MKVKCISNEGHMYCLTLTIGKEYKVLGERDTSYKIKDDNGDIDYFSWTKFEIVNDNEEEKEMKEYTFEEVIANIKEGETYKCTNITFVVHTITRDFAGIKFNNNEPMNFCGINNEQKFIKIGHSVSFNEVLFSNRKCRVYYKKYDIVNTDRYDTLDNILRNIVQFRKECDLKDLIINGDWYLE